MSSTYVTDPSRLGYYNTVRLNASNITRVNNVDEIIVEEENDVGEELVLGICHVPILIRMTQLDANGVRIRNVKSDKDFAGGLLALHHLNTGDGSVVKEVEGLNERCPLRFTSETIDTEGSEVATVEKLLSVLDRTPGQQNELLPCAFLGAGYSRISIPTSILTGIKGYPQLSHLSTSSQLDNKNQYKEFGRTIPSDDGTAYPAIKYLIDELGVYHLGVLYTGDSYGLGYALSLQKVSNRIAPQMKIVTAELPVETTADYIKEIDSAIRILASSNFRYFYGIVNGAKDYDQIMTIAYDHGIAGPGFTWMFSDSLSPTSNILGRNFPKGSKLAAATAGSSMLSPRGGLPGVASYDAFAKAWAGLQREEEYLATHIATYDDEGYVPPTTSEMFEGYKPGFYSAFMYDAAISLGLSACAIVEEQSDPREYFTGPQHFEAIRQTTYEGASGRVVLDNITASRVPESAVFELTNYVPREGRAGITFDAVQSDIFQSDGWKQINNYTFSTGSTVPPPDLPPLETNYNYIGAGLRAAGLVLAVVALMMSLGFAWWTYVERNSKVVKISQPIFLLIICAGTFLMASAIVPLSIDDEIASQTGCDVACMLAPWFFSVGFAVAFAALLSKTLRLNKIFYNNQFQRMQVSAKDVMVPLVVVISANVVILTAWTIVSPFVWTRTVTSTDSFGRPSQSVGRCSSEQSLPFYVTLFAVNAAALIFALYEAWRARLIKTELGETTYIAMTMSAMLLVAAVGIPITIIANDNPRAFYFVVSCIIFVTCTALLLFIFIPKVQFHRKVRDSRASVRHIVTELARGSQAIRRESNVSGEGVLSVASTAKKRLSHAVDNMKEAAQDIRKKTTSNARLESMLENERDYACNSDDDSIDASCHRWTGMDRNGNIASNKGRRKRSELDFGSSFDDYSERSFIGIDRHGNVASNIARKKKSDLELGSSFDDKSERSSSIYKSNSKARGSFGDSNSNGLVVLENTQQMDNSQGLDLIPVDDLVPSKVSEEKEDDDDEEEKKLDPSDSKDLDLLPKPIANEASSETSSTTKSSKETDTKIKKSVTFS